MKVFISGPISGTVDYKKRFKVAEKKLREAGHIVINPVKLTDQLPNSTPWEKYMTITLAALNTCDAVYMLKGWKKSNGAHIENLWADKTEKIIFYEVE